jgi:hypothetical protein
MGRASILTIAAATVAIVLGCSRRDDGPAIRPDRERTSPVATAEVPPPPAAPTAPEAPARDPLDMPLKHDVPDPAGTPAKSAATDPCALEDPKGPLAMKLRHDKPNAPGARNPLCMRIK